VVEAQSAEMLAPAHPARDKIAQAGDARAYICVATTCSLPVTDPAALAAAIETVRHS
jgi:uncharacterized protein YyaL (SSP411 family)